MTIEQMLSSITIHLPVFEEETPPFTDHQIYMLEMGIEPSQEDTNHD